MVINLAETRMSTLPYPGLRTFHRNETDIFFGREEHTDQLLKKLGSKRFLSVVGPSGCGKSSLVRAGLIAALETGFFAEAGADWRVADMRPGDQPLERLAESLLSPDALGAEYADDPHAASFLLATLRRGPRGLVEAVRGAGLGEKTNVLLLVDQFEEIFRFRERRGNADEADAFVALLLATKAQSEVPVYVVITMRSDFLGNCAVFAGLPEAINDSQFLTPRLTRAQNSAAITGPARVFGGDVSSELLNRLLNDIGPDPDQLPLLQHVLMRMWQLADRRAAKTANDGPVMTLAHYEDERVGGIAKALSKHADEVFEQLQGEQQRVAEVMFRCLTERSVGRQDTRRPMRLNEVAAIARVKPAEVARVVEEFRGGDRSFVMPPPNIRLTPETKLDIGHESLIGRWERLDKWADEEARSAAAYKRLKESARLWLAGDVELLGPLEVERALTWWQKQRPNCAWARLYDDDPQEFRQAVKYLHSSRRLDVTRRREAEARARREKEEKEERERREREAEIERQRNEEKFKAAKVYKRLAASLAVVIILALVAAGLALQQQRAALSAQRATAEEQGKVADLTKNLLVAETARRQDSEEQRKALEEKQKALEDQQKTLDKANTELKKQVERANEATATANARTREAEAAKSQLASALRDAQTERDRANTQAAIAITKTKEALDAKADAEKKRVEAETARKDAEAARDFAKSETERANDEARKANRRLEQVEAAGNATALSKQASDLIDRNNYQEALRALQEALPLYEKSDNLAGQAEVLFNSGVAHDRIGNYAKASEFFSSAVPKYEKLGDKRSQATALMNLGWDYIMMNRNFEASSVLLAALPVFRAQRYADYVAYTQLGIGKALTDRAQAIEFLKAAEEYYDENDKSRRNNLLEIDAIREIQKAYHSLGQTEKANHYAKKLRKKELELNSPHLLRSEDL